MTDAEFNARGSDVDSGEAHRQLRVVAERGEHLLGHAADRRSPRQDLRSFDVNGVERAPGPRLIRSRSAPGST